MSPQGIPRNLLYFIFLLLPLPALAWGPEGHQIVAMIAMDHLSPTAARAVREILGKKTLAEEASWADIVKRKPPKNKPWYRDFSYTEPWHYINLPIDQKVDAVSFPRYLKGRDNVVSQIPLQADVLKDPSLKPREKRDALRFLVHLVGDVHMPLHCAVSGDDEGGNTEMVKFGGKRMSLHAFWDRLPDWRRTGDSRALANRIERTLTPAQERAWTKGDPETWALESYLIAKRTVYPGYERLRARDNRRVLVLRDADAEEAEEIVDERLAKAGLRLAATLNDLFASAR